jgi:cell volume regulation protein A
MIVRNGIYIRPGGSTIIEANDLLMVLADDVKDFDLVKECLISGIVN